MAWTGTIRAVPCRAARSTDPPRADGSSSSLADGGSVCSVTQELGARSPWFDQLVHGPLRAPVLPFGDPIDARPIPVRESSDAQGGGVTATGDGRNPWTATERHRSAQTLHSTPATPARLTSQAA